VPGPLEDNSTGWFVSIGWYSTLGRTPIDEKFTIRSTSKVSAASRMLTVPSTFTWIPVVRFTARYPGSMIIPM